MAEDLDRALSVLGADDEPAQSRLEAIQELAQLGSMPDSGVQTLLAVFVDRSESPNLRLAALDAMREKSSAARTVPALMVVAKNNRDVFEMRSAALEALVSMIPHALAFWRDLATLLADPSEEERFREVVAHTLQAFAVELAATTDGETCAIGSLDQTLAVVSEIQDILEERHPELVSELEPVIEGLRLKKLALSKSGFPWTAFFQDPRTWTLFLALPPVFCLPVWIILLIRSPKWIWSVNALLERLPEFKASAGVNLPFGLRGYLLVSLFQHHPRVLDAWLNERWPAIRAAFESMDAVAERKVRAPIRVRLKGDAERELTAVDFQEMFRRQSASLLVLGEEGMGKTSLAFQIARWAMSEIRSDRLAEHRMVPVLIEEIGEREAAANLDDWIGRIEKALTVLLGVSESVGTALTVSLLRTRRLLIIFDDAIATFPGVTSLVTTHAGAGELLRALLVTTPLPEPNCASFDYAVEVIPIEIPQLAKYFDDCLVEAGERDRFRDSEVLKACVEIERAAGWPVIPVWIARLWVDLMIRSKSGARTREWPANLGELLAQEVEARNESVPSDDRLDLARVVQTLKRVAWQCLKGGARRAEARRIDVLKLFDDESRASEWLTYLDERLRLLRCGCRSEPSVSVRSQPLAYHFASLHLCDICGSDAAGWEVILNGISGIAEKSDSAQRFLGALYQTCLARADALRIPEPVLARMGSLAAQFETQAIKECSERQVKRMSRQLLLPDSEDRKAAATGLSRMGAAAAEAIPALVSRLSRLDESLSVRLEIVETLGRIGRNSDLAVSALIRVLKEPFTVLRPAAGRALVRIGAKARAGLTEVLKGPRRNEAFGLTVLKTIGEFDCFDAQTVEMLRTLVMDSGATEAVRRGGVEALAKVGRGAISSVPDLIDLMLENRALRRSAAKAMIAIAPDAKASIISLFEMLEGGGSRGSEETLAMFHDSLLQSKQSAKPDPESMALVRQAFERAIAVARTRAATPLNQSRAG